jgi:aspartyl-tRNA(Asn)/glutamyl-tRNA(Gln) amidotransferase subunit C
MAVTESDVRRVAELARLGLPDTRVPSLVVELNTILDHMAVLAKVDTTGAQEAAGVGDGGMPLRADSGVPYPLARDLSTFAPAARDGFLVVPRLATHVTPQGTDGTGRDSVADDEGENVLSPVITREQEQEAP